MDKQTVSVRKIWPKSYESDTKLFGKTDDDIFKVLIKKQSEGLADIYKRIEDTMTLTECRDTNRFKKN